MFPVIVSGSLTLTRLVPRRRSPVPSLFWFIHTFCGCPRRRSHVSSHRFWSGVTPAAPAQPRAEKEKTPRDEAASESPSGLSFPRPPGACALAHTREETGRAAQEREKEREHRQRERGLLVHQPCARERARAQRQESQPRERREREHTRHREAPETDRQTDRQAGRQIDRQTDRQIDR